MADPQDLSKDHSFLAWLKRPALGAMGNLQIDKLRRFFGVDGKAAATPGAAAADKAGPDEAAERELHASIAALCVQEGDPSLAATAIESNLQLDDVRYLLKKRAAEKTSADRSIATATGAAPGGGQYETSDWAAAIEAVNRKRSATLHAGRTYASASGKIGRGS